jgi:type IV pilus assembly protein PilF
VTGKLLSLATLCAACCVLNACSRDVNASLHVSYPNLQNARVLAAQAINDMHNGDTPDATQKINFALSEAPNDPLVLDAMGFYLEKAGDLDGANGFYFKALLTAPQSGTIRNNYGAFLCRNGYSEDAINYFMQAALTPGYPHPEKAYANARYCAQVLGDSPESAYYTKLLKENSPQSINIRESNRY